MRVSQSRRGDGKLQLCAPEIYRREVLALYHEHVSRYLGTTKSKDKGHKCYFWSNCYRYIEKY